MDDVPTEVQVWLNKGWKIIPSERRGYVIAGEKKMRRIDRIGLTVGIALLLGFVIGFVLLGVLGVVLVVGAVLDYRFNTKPTTKFFPEPGEKKRLLNRD